MGCSRVISHEQVQAALSARIDGESPGIDDAVVDAHLAECPECTAFWERSLALSQRVSFAEVGGGMAPPRDLSDVIMAGVDEKWRRLAQRRLVTLAIGRVFLVLAAVVWAGWAVGLLLDDAAVHGLTTSTAAVRFGVALALGVTAWRPRQIPGVLLIVGTMFTFTAGFAVRDWILATGEFVPSIVLIPLFTLIGLVWTWVADRGIEVRRAWHLLDANPS